MWIDSRSIWSVLWADGWMDVGGAGLEQKGRFWHFPEIGHKGRGAGLVVGMRRRAWPAAGWAAQVKEAVNDPGKGSEWKCNHLKREIKVTFRLHPLPKSQCLPSRKTSESKHLWSDGCPDITLGVLSLLAQVALPALTPATWGSGSAERLGSPQPTPPPPPLPSPTPHFTSVHLHGGLCLLSSSSSHFLPLSFTFFRGSWCGKRVVMFNSAAGRPGSMGSAVYHPLAGSARSEQVASPALG